jgi:hypothetical protein
MKEYSQEELKRSANLIIEAMPLSLKIIEFLEQSGVEMDVAVVAAGIAYSSGSHSVGASLPSTIDLVRFFYKEAETPRETH